MTCVLLQLFRFVLSFTIISCFQVQANSFWSQSHVPRQYDNNVVHIDENAKDHHLDFYSFVTRPDIDAPKWDVTIYDNESLSPGYWFIAPYQEVVQRKPGSGWVGPHIYDSHGELVWSGGPMFKGFNTFDFRVVEVEGNSMMSLIYPEEEVGILMNSSYKKHGSVRIGEKEVTLNIHDFNVIEDGTRALVVNRETKTVSKDVLAGLEYNDECRVTYNGFEEYDMATKDSLFAWSSEKHVGLEESVLSQDDALDEKCKKQWDYVYV